MKRSKGYGHRADGYAADSDLGRGGNGQVEVVRGRKQTERNPEERPGGLGCSWARLWWELGRNAGTGQTEQKRGLRGG